MASSLIGTLRVALSLGTADFEAGANKAASIARSKSKQIEGSFNGAKAAVTGFFAAFTIGALAEVIKKSLDYAGSLAEVSRTLGVTTKDLQAFRFVASQTGVSQDVLEASLRKLTVSMGKAQLGSKAQIDAFKAIGISVDALKGKTTGDVFRLMADGLSKVSDRSQRAAVEVALLKKGGEQLDNALVGGSARINELSEAAQKLGIILSDQQIQGAEETAHKLAAVKEVLAAQIAGVVANNANAILSLSSALATLTGEIARFLGSNPQLALGIVGALLGGRVGGLPGAAVGVVGGVMLGNKLAQTNADSNMDLQFRMQQVRNAKAALTTARSAPDVDGRVMPGIGIQASAGGRQNVIAAIKELNRQSALLAQATAATTAPKGRPGVDLPKFLAPPSPKAKKGPTDRSDDVEFQFAQEERRAEMDILQAKMDLSHDIDERAKLSLQMLDLEQQSRDAEIDHRVSQAQRDFADHKITKATLDEVTASAAILKQKGDESDALKRQLILEQAEEDRQRQAAEIEQHSFEIRGQLLQKEADLAETASERRAIELQLLELAYQEKRLALQRIIDTSKDQAAITNARADMSALNANHSLDRAGVIQQTRGPLEQYMAGLPTDAAKWQEALQNVAVNGFGTLEQSILDTISGVKSLGEAFRAVASQIVADLLRIAIQKMVIAPLANALGGVLGGIGGGLGGGGLGAMAVSGLSSAPLASLGGGLTSGMVAGLPGLASGGDISIRGNMGRDRNLLSLNGVPVARVNYGERIPISNDNGSGSRGGHSIYAPITIGGGVKDPYRTGQQIGAGLKSRIAKTVERGG
jgi:hypothetical protein